MCALCVQCIFIHIMSLYNVIKEHNIMFTFIYDMFVFFLYICLCFMLILVTQHLKFYEYTKSFYMNE